MGIRAGTVAAAGRKEMISMAVLRWLGGAGVVVAGVVASALLGLLVLLAVAAMTPGPAVFMTAGVGAGLGVWLTGHHRLSRASYSGGHLSRSSLSRASWRSRAVAGVGAAGVIALVGAALVPLGDRWVPPEAPPGAGTWHLPDGGSLAYGVVHAADGAAEAAPVIVLHGGPGVPDTAGLLRVLGPLADAGHDVWAYDQRGTGRSSRLTDPRGYTTALGVADLTQVHERIGAERVILVGHSYGAYLAAAYIAEHPDRVERAVFLSPGDLRNDGTHGNPQDRLTTAEQARLYRLLISPRALLTYALVQVNPVAARALARDREVDARQDRVYAAALPGLHCRGRSGPALHGMGFYAATVPQAWRGPAEPDVVARLGARDLPVLVVKGQCDYLDWESAVGFLRSFADSHLLYLPGAGHDVHVDDPERVREAVEDFVAGRTVRGTLDDPMHVPAGFQP